MQLGITAQPRRALSTKQDRDEIRTIRRHLEHRFIEQMLQHILAPDVDNEREMRLKCGKVSEVFVPGQHRDTHRPVLWFDNVVPWKRAARFRKIRHQSPEVCITDLDGNRHGKPEKPNRKDERAREQKNGCAKLLKTEMPHFIFHIW
jgi:hypothetical protein